MRTLALSGAILPLGVLLIAGAAILGWRQHDAAAATAAVEISPAASSGAYSNGQQVTVSVGSNSVFQAGKKVNILECADPGGTTANLPKDDSTCDGNTIQGSTVLVQNDGSITASQYTLYELPSSTLGETSTGQPVCNQSNECVLYVGESQNDFTQPKLFSAPFSIRSSGTSPGTNASSGGNGSSGANSSSGSSPSSTTATTNGSSAAGGSSSSAGGTSTGGDAADSPTVSPDGAGASSQGSLAYTGVSPALYVIGALGAVLAVGGGISRRLLGARS
jgi:hypothetical protein